MNFLRQLGEYVDNVWTLIGIPALIGAFFWAFEFVPLITGGLLVVAIMMCFRQASACDRNYEATKDRDYLSLYRYNVGMGASLLVFGVAMFTALTYFTVHSESEMCKDMTHMIPGTLTGIVQTLVPHTCGESGESYVASVLSRFH